MFLPTLLIFIASFVLLSYAGSLLVRSLTRVSELLGLSEYIVAFVFMSIATSIPELFIGLASAFQNVPTISLGNTVGTNLINLTLIIGIVAIIARGIKIESKISHQNFLLIFFFAFLPILLATDGIISRGDGLLLLIAFFFYITRLLHDREYFTKRVEETEGKELSVASILGTFKSLKMFFIGVLLLILSSLALIWSAQGMAEYFNIGLLFFGVVFIALGTALPELVFGIKSAIMKHTSMMLGNSLGSIAFNATFIIGLVALIRPISIDFSNGLVYASFFLFFAFLLFNIFSYSRGRISRNEGIVLILFYGVFIFVGFLG